MRGHGSEKEDAIIRFLVGAKGHFSGEQMARQLRISRTAVWNHINQLKALGFEIESQPHLGYRLVRVPDSLLPVLVSDGLKPARIGRKIIYFEQATSSNDEAEKLARAGEQEGTAVIAEGQSAGRGRLGRVWHSPGRKGVYLSVILRPAISPSKIPFITLYAAVSATEAIRRCSGLAAFVKWPNDVLLSGRKVCGILTELATEADSVNYVIVGAGINVNTQREDFPPEIQATSLSIETGREHSRREVTRSFLQALDRNYALLAAKKYDEIIERWLALSSTVGRRIRAESLSGKVWEGVATGLDVDGCLLLRLDNGLTHRLTGGDVTLL